MPSLSVDLVCHVNTGHAASYLHITHSLYCLLYNFEVVYNYRFHWISTCIDNLLTCTASALLTDVVPSGVTEEDTSQDVHTSYTHTIHSGTFVVCSVYNRRTFRELGN